MKNLLDRSVALAPGGVLAVILLAVLDVQVADPVVVLLDVSDRVISGGEKVADVEVDPEVFSTAPSPVQSSPEWRTGWGP